MIYSKRVYRAIGMTNPVVCELKAIIWVISWVLHRATDAHTTVSLIVYLEWVCLLNWACNPDIYSVPPSSFAVGLLFVMYSLRSAHVPEKVGVVLARACKRSGCEIAYQKCSLSLRWSPVFRMLGTQRCCDDRLQFSFRKRTDNLDLHEDEPNFHKLDRINGQNQRITDFSVARLPEISICLLIHQSQNNTFRKT